jgi:PleD family two-component response regulator
MQASVKANPFLWKGQAINLSLSIGLSSREDGSMPDETLIELANQAVQRARREGGSRIRMTTFDPATLDVGVTSTTEQVPPKRDTGAA